MKFRYWMPAGILSALLLPYAAWAGQEIQASYVSASSVLYEEGYDHSPYNIQDYDPATAWVEGAYGNGIGETLSLGIPAGSIVTGGFILDGYQKNDDLFYKNSAPSRLRFSSGNQTLTLDLSSEADTYYGYGGGCYFTFDYPLISDGEILVEIVDVRPGWKYEDTCISELRMTVSEGQPSGAAGQGSAGNGTQGGNGAGGQTPDRSPEKTDQAGLTRSDRAGLSSLAYWTLSRHQGYSDTVPSGSQVAAEDLTIEDQAFLLYWYQYNINDDRIARSSNPEYNEASPDTFLQIAGELFGDEEGQNMIGFFEENYVEGRGAGVNWLVSGTGDFGDAGSWYFAEYTAFKEEDGMFLIRGDVKRWNNAAGTYENGGSYTAWFTPNAGRHFGGAYGAWKIEKVSVS